MATFNTNLSLPSYTTDVQRGGGPSALFIRTANDFSAVYTSAMWDMITLFSKRDYEISGAGGGNKPLDIQFVHGPTYVVPDLAVSSPLLSKKITWTIARENMYEFIDTVAGNRYFVVDCFHVVGVTKRVFFGFGYFEPTAKFSSQYGSVKTVDVVFNIYADGLATAPTLPALPTNSDTKCIIS